MHTVVTLLKDILSKGHLSNKDSRIILAASTMNAFSPPAHQRTPLYTYYSEDRIIWLKGCSYTPY